MPNGAVPNPTLGRGFLGRPAEAVSAAPSQVRTVRRVRMREVTSPPLPCHTAGMDQHFVFSGVCTVCGDEINLSLPHHFVPQERRTVGAASLKDWPEIIKDWPEIGATTDGASLRSLFSTR